MSGVNKVILLGRLTAKPELKYTPSSQAVCQFTIATSKEWTDKQSGEKKEKAEFSRIIVWGKLGELCSQYLDKGRQCYLEGSLETRSWDDKDGKKCYMTEINATTVQFIGGGQKKEDDGDHDQRPRDSKGKSQDYQPEVDERYTSDSIPF